MSFSEVIGPFVPWIVVLSSFVVGVGLSYGCRFAQHAAERHHWRGRSLFAALRGAIVLYAVALGLALAPFDFGGKTKPEALLDRTEVALVIIATTMVISRLLVYFVQSLGQRHGDRFPSSTLFANIAQILAIVLGALILLQSLDIAIAPILTALGVGGLAVALALRDTLANLFSGIQIVAAHQLRPGDYIKIQGGVEGYVVDIAWRNTTLRELGNNLVVVPNETLVSSIFTNYSRPEQKTVLSVEIVVGFLDDLERVSALAVEVARSVAREVGAPDDEPFVRFRQISDSGLTLATFLAVGKYGDQALAKSLFLQRFYTRAAQDGVFIPRQPWAEPPPPKSASEAPAGS
jgi:small-conductance mechanosensitive channel